MPAISTRMGFVPTSDIEGTNLMSEIEGLKADIDAQLSTLNTDITSTATTAAAYTPASPSSGAQWADPDPATVAEALNRLANAVYLLRGSVAIP